MVGWAGKHVNRNLIIFSVFIVYLWRGGGGLILADLFLAASVVSAEYSSPNVL